MFDQEQCHLFQSLFDKHTCIRCILRILKITDIALYRDSTKYVEMLYHVGQQLGNEKLLLEDYDFLKQKRKGQATPLTEHNPQVHSTLKEFQVKNSFYEIENANNCNVCLGILQTIDDPKLVTAMIEDLKKKDYDFEAFKFAVKTPIGVSIRQMGVINQIVMESGKPSMLFANIQTPSNIVDLKVAVKWIISSLIAEQLNVKGDAYDDRFCINLQFENLSDDIEQFRPFKEAIQQIDDQHWEEKISKKCKMSDPQLKYETQNRLNQKRNLQQSPFLPTSTNLEKIQKITLQQFMTVPMAQVNYVTKLEINTAYANVYIKGKYIKLARFISQTPWFIDGNKMYEDSIQDLVCQYAVEVFKPSSLKFHSGGREDIDVRMLGEGRPFMLELVDPHKALHNQKDEFLIKMVESINKSSSIRVPKLEFTDQQFFADLKDSETNKVKAYCCIVQSNKPVDPELIKKTNLITDLVLDQKTPLRVLHRRTLMIRQKTIHAIRIIQLSERWFQVYVLSSAGTYIKEFIHGDLERTKTNLGELLECECDIFQLDVIKLYEKLDEAALQSFYKLDEECNSKQLA